MEVTRLNNRRMARDLAFQLLFEESLRDDDIEEIIELAKESRDIEPDEYTYRVVRGTVAHKNEIDETIGSLAHRRSVSRLSRVVLCCLRLAMFEIDHIDDVDVSVSINEAVELAKTYSSQKEAGYVNGLLGTYVRGKTADGGSGEAQ